MSEKVKDTVAALQLAMTLMTKDKLIKALIVSVEFGAKTQFEQEHGEDSWDKLETDDRLSIIGVALSQFLQYVLDPERYIDKAKKEMKEEESKPSFGFDSEA